METCGNCKHWKQDDNPPFGKCLRIPHDDNFAINSWSLPGEEGPEFNEYAEKHSVCVQDGSGYYAAILCQSDFGCVLHERVTKGDK